MLCGQCGAVNAVHIRTARRAEKFQVFRVCTVYSFSELIVRTNYLSLSLSLCVKWQPENPTEEESVVQFQGTVCVSINLLPSSCPMKSPS